MKNITAMSRNSSFTHRYRRRIASFAAAVVVGALLSPTKVSCAAGAHVLPVDNPPAISIVNAATLRNNMRHWTRDYAVMFYAPWCQLCKESFLPMWEEVAIVLAEQDPKDKRKLTMAKFDCEEDDAAKEFCNEIGLAYYPTFFFYGSGKFHDHDPLTGMFRNPPTAHDSSARFATQAFVYTEVMLDWVQMMNFVSKSNRFMGKINIFGGGHRSKEKRLEAEIELLQRQNAEMQRAVARESSASVGSIYGHGDTYRELREVDYAPEFTHVMSCVVDVATQYCALDGVKERDDWCNSKLEMCAASGFEDTACWPETCPLQDTGCRLVSWCLSPEGYELYAQAYAQLESGAEWEEMDPQEIVALGTAASGVGTSEEHVEMGAGGGLLREQVETSDSAALPPFLGRRPHMDRPTDEGRGETVAA